MAITIIATTLTPQGMAGLTVAVTAVVTDGLTCVGADRDRWVVSVVIVPTIIRFRRMREVVVLPLNVGR
jgi:hypothetical protein